jgi:hypothetical protein
MMLGMEKRVYLMLHGGALSREALRGAAYGMWRQGAGDATVNNGFGRPFSRRSCPEGLQLCKIHPLHQRQEE